MTAIKKVINDDYQGEPPGNFQGMSYAQAECYRHNTPLSVRKAIAKYHNDLQHSATHSSLHELIAVLRQLAEDVQRRNPDQIVPSDQQVIETVRQSGTGLQILTKTDDDGDEVEDVFRTVCSAHVGPSSGQHPSRVDHKFWPELGPKVHVSPV